LVVSRGSEKRKKAHSLRHDNHAVLGRPVQMGRRGVEKESE